MRKKISNWSEQVDETEKYHTPPGTFTKKSSEIVQILMKGAEENPELALKRLVFYMNRAGDKLSNKEQLQKAKIALEAKIK